MRGKKQPKALSGALRQGLGLNQGLKGFKTSTQGLMGGHWISLHAVSVTGNGPFLCKFK